MYCEECGQKYLTIRGFVSSAENLLGLPHGRSLIAGSKSSQSGIYRGPFRQTVAETPISRLLADRVLGQGKVREPVFTANGRIHGATPTRIDPEKVRGVPAGVLKGFRAFINWQQSEMLIRHQR